jgi:hypothetical protein
MSQQESDGVHEFAQGQVRTMLLVAAQVGEALARARAERLRELEHGEREALAALRERLAAEQRAAAATLRDGAKRGWDSATPAQVSDAVEAGSQWAGESAAIDADRRELWDWARETHGVDLGDLQTQVDAARATLLAQRADALRESADGREDEGATLLGKAADDLQESVDAVLAGEPGQAQGLAAAAGRHEQDAEVAYDSAERREELAARLTERGFDEEVVSAAVTADLGNALPVSAAVAQAATNGRKPAKARKTPGKAKNDPSRGR